MTAPAIRNGPARKSNRHKTRALAFMAFIAFIACRGVSCFRELQQIYKGSAAEFKDGLRRSMHEYHVRALLGLAKPVTMPPRMIKNQDDPEILNSGMFRVPVQQRDVHQFEFVVQQALYRTLDRPGNGDPQAQTSNAARGSLHRSEVKTVFANSSLRNNTSQDGQTSGHPIPIHSTTGKTLPASAPCHAQPSTKQ